MGYNVDGYPLAHTLGRGKAQFGHHQFHDANARVRINADFFDARKRSAGLRVVNALAVAEILAVINTSCRISAWSRIGSRIALAARNPVLQIVAVVVDGAPETQEWWCITTSGDALFASSPLGRPYSASTSTGRSRRFLTTVLFASLNKS
jgi:hypothetical protein